MKNSWTDEIRRGVVAASKLQAGKFIISVHRHIHYPENVWLLSCSGLFDNRQLASELLSEAKCQAAALVQVDLEAAVQVILSA